MRGLFLILVCLSSVRCTSAYSDGSVAAVCDSMLPGHAEFSPQSTTPPYRVRVNGSTYRPGDHMTVTLEAVQNGQHFKGFMLQARRAAGGSAVGSFSSANTGFKLHNCFNQENSTISHSSSEMKTRFEATWVAPLTPSLGNIEFCATFVREYNDFWTMVSSGIISGSSVVSEISAHVILTAFAVHALKI